MTTKATTCACDTLDEGGVFGVIHYCPLHEAAPELAHALAGLVEVVKQVEWEGGEYHGHGFCLWCQGAHPDEDCPRCVKEPRGHKPDCQREIALAAAEAALKGEKV